MVRHTCNICSKIFNPIQDTEGGKKVPYQFFLCNFYKRRN